MWFVLMSAANASDADPYLWLEEAGMVALRTTISVRSCGRCRWSFSGTSWDSESAGGGLAWWRGLFR